MKILKETKLLRKIHFKRAGKIPFNNAQVDTNKLGEIRDQEEG